jgi:chromate transporter
MTAGSDRIALGAIFSTFLRFGFLAWGGPVAQIAMIREELIERRHWISRERFNRLLAVYQLLPGPEAHELCVHLGVIKGGRWGGFLAGLGFMLPGLLLILALASLYSRIDVGGGAWAALFLGIQLGVLALIVRAVHRIGQHIVVDRLLWMVAIAAFIASIIGVSFWIILPAAAATAALARSGRTALAISVSAIAALVAILASRFASPDAAPMLTAAGTASVLALFAAGLKAGLLTFGGAYTAIPFVRADAVGKGWVSEGQFLDGVALGGIIPAPLVIVATFVGFLAGGLAGGLAITAGIFLPAFAFALLFYDRLEKIVENERLHALLEGVAAAVVGIIAATAIDIGGSLAGNVPSLTLAALIFLAALLLVYRWKSSLAPVALVPLSALAGWLLFG